MGCCRSNVVREGAVIVAVGEIFVVGIDDRVGTVISQGVFNRLYNSLSLLRGKIAIVVNVASEIGKTYPKVINVTDVTGALLVTEKTCKQTVNRLGRLGEGSLAAWTFPQNGWWRSLNILLRPLPHPAPP